MNKKQRLLAEIESLIYELDQKRIDPTAFNEKLADVAAKNTAEDLEVHEAIEAAEEHCSQEPFQEDVGREEL